MAHSCPDVYDGTSAVGESDTAFPVASVGQPALLMDRAAETTTPASHAEPTGRATGQSDQGANSYPTGQGGQSSMMDGAA